MTQPELQFEKVSQHARILAELKKGRALTKWIIIHELGVLNAGARLSEIRKGKYDGVCYPIEKEMIEVPKSRARVAKYFLVNAETDTSPSHVGETPEAVRVS